MAGKTNSELIRELSSTVAILGERVENVGSEVDRVDRGQTKSEETLKELDKQVAFLKQELSNLTVELKKSENRRWQLTAGVIVAVVAAVLSIAGNIALAFVPK